MDIYESRLDRHSIYIYKQDLRRTLASRIVYQLYAGIYYRIMFFFYLGALIREHVLLEHDLLLGLEFCRQGANVWLNLDAELITGTKILGVGLFPCSDSSGSTGDNDSSRGKCSTLRAEANDSRNVEDEITVDMTSQFPKTKWNRLGQTHSIPQSCMTLPFFKPLMCSFDGSGTSLELASTGPMGHAPSKPLL